MEKKVRVEVFYSPSCVFSFRDLEKVRQAASSFGKQVVCEEISTYEGKARAESRGIYGLIPRDRLLVYIDDKKYQEALNVEDLSKAISKALRDKG